MKCLLRVALTHGKYFKIPILSVSGERGKGGAEEHK
jgi:hypothetical protein